MMKERYEKTKLEVIIFTADDVLRTSTDPPITPDPPITSSDPYELPVV